jgi:hypothetical protein
MSFSGGGAASGAAAGSSFGPWGTAIGAIAGGLFGGGEDKAAKARQAQADAVWKQNWSITNSMVPWLSALTTGNYGASGGTAGVPQFMRVDVNNPYTPQELAGQQTLSNLGLSGWQRNIEDKMQGQQARMGVSDSSHAWATSAGSEDAYQRARAEEQARLSGNLYTARQSARTEAAKNFYNLLESITGTNQYNQAQGMADRAQRGYSQYTEQLAKVLGSIFGGSLGGGSGGGAGGVSGGTTPYDATPTGNTGGIDWGF